MKLDWKKIWDEFDDACRDYRDRHSKTCNKCYQPLGDSEPTWENQQKMIQRIVNKQIVLKTVYTKVR